MSVEIQNYLIPCTCTNKQPYNVFLGFLGKYRSFWSGISDPGPQSISDQFPKIWFRSGQKVWTVPKMAGPSHPYITTSLFSLSHCPCPIALSPMPAPLSLTPCPFALVPIPLPLCSYMYALAPMPLLSMPLPICPFSYVLSPMRLTLCPCRAH